MKLKYACIILAASALTVNGQVFNLLLSGSQETTPVTNGSGGYATVELSGTSLSYNIVHKGMADITGAHFHGNAAAGVNAGVQVGLTAGASPIAGTTTITTQQAADLQAGLWYLNLHSTAFGSGEIRGQVVQQLSFTPNTLITGSQETSPVSTAAAGAAYVEFNTDTNLLSWNIAFEGLTPVGMHFHGDAALGANAGVQVNIGSISGLTSESNGSTTITSSQAAGLLAGNWYINIHTSTNPGGEIRGQLDNITVVPEPSQIAALMGFTAFALILIRRRR